MARPGVCLLLGFAVWLFVGPSESLRAQCVQFEDPADMFRLADAVFLGTVRSTEPTGARGFHLVMHKTLFEIQQVWKGEVRKFETVGTVEAFERETRYLVFASLTNRPLPSALRTSLECGWSEVEAKSNQKLKWLAANAGKPREPSGR